MHRVFLILVGIYSLAACTTSDVLIAHSVGLDSSVETIPEQQLLDVGIMVFNPGVPEGEIDKDVLEELLQEGTFVHIRRTESLYMAVQLSEAMQRSGHWGAVWVTPSTSAAADLVVTAEILHSDGDTVRVQVEAKDATGRVWLDEPYELETAAGAYNRQRYPDLDPYQDMFHSIANDLSIIREQLSAEERQGIRTVGEVRYASELNPDAFGEYVAEDKKGNYELLRLPAADDPVFGRTLQVRQRERLFFETLNQHYTNFSNEAAPSYDGWREYAREEAIAIREMTRSARWRTGIGIASIVASIVYGQNAGNDAFSDRLIRDGLMYIGMDMIRTSAVRRQEKRLHTETLEELSVSFDDEVEPLVVDVAGTQHRLTGTVEVQYTEWRDLLQRLYISETGLAPEDFDVYVEPDEQPLDEQLPVQQEPSGEAEEAQEASSDATEGVVVGGT